MSQITISIHPYIKKIIENLDLDLGRELNRYEQSFNQSSVLIPDFIIEQNITAIPETNLKTLPSSLIYHPPVIEDDPIPVASRIISDSPSILDMILTPWGIVGIILFFGANILIFFTQIQNIKVSNSVNNETVNNVDNQENSKEDNFPMPENSVNKEQNSTNLNPIDTPSLPIPLPEINDSSISNNSPQNSSVYPDLKTALFAEIQKKQAVSPSPLSNNSIPLPPLSVTTLPEENISNQISLNSPRQPITNPSTTSVVKRYYILTNYQNMNNFNRIKSIVPNALITNVNQEMKIQLGVSNTENEGKKLAQKWENQGIKTFMVESN